MTLNSERHHNIAGDFIRYTLFLFVPLFISAALYCYFKGFSFIALIVNPLVYSIGISLIIIVISHDINDLLDIVGLGEKAVLKLDIKYAHDIQEISLLMSSSNYHDALGKVNTLLKKEPQLVAANILCGEILLHGFNRSNEARQCFDKVLKLSSKGDEQYTLAQALKAATY